MKLLMIGFLFVMPLTMVKNSAAYEETSVEQKSFEMKPGGSIIVISDEGNISVNSWESNEVKLVMKKRAWARSKSEAKELLKKLEIEIEHTANLSIRQVKFYDERHFSFWDIFDPDNWGKHNWSVTVDFELTVPRQSDLRLETDEGDVDVTDILGDLEIAVDEGNVELKDIEYNHINVKIDEGDFDCYNLMGDGGRINLETDEGTIRLEKGKVTKLLADCDEGDIYLKDIELGNCELNTDEGDIEARMSLQPQGKYRLSTDEGNVRIYLSKNINLDVKLETAEGDIDTDFDLTITELDDGERARGTIGDGSAQLEVYTDEGDIILERE